MSLSKHVSARNTKNYVALFMIKDRAASSSFLQNYCSEEILSALYNIKKKLRDKNVTILFLEKNTADFRMTILHANSM